MTRKDRVSDLGAVPDEKLFEDDMMDFTMDELREFLEADHLDVQADPRFKERLRRKLWDLLLARSQEVGKPDGEL